MANLKKGKIISLFTTLHALSLCSAGANPSTNLPPAPEILATASKVNDYWIANNGLGDAGWSEATYYTGNQRFYEITQNQAYLERGEDWGNTNGWLRSEKSRFNGDQIRNDEDADNHCCGQTYIDLYTIDPQPNRISDFIRVENYVVGESRNNFWTWIDAFYMHAPTLAKLSTLTTNSIYSDKLWDMYQHTRDIEGGSGLFDATEGLWFRDKKYIYPDEATSNDNKVFWARGNGWMIAGLCRVIDNLPHDASNRDSYVSMVQTMAEALIPLQQDDGFWRASLLEPIDYDMPETSGTSFFTYAMAWGMNNGILDRKTYLPVVAKAWNGLVTESVHPNGFLGYVQLVAAAPGASYYENTKAYGVGAFLLAASELSLLVGDEIAVFAGADQTVFDFDLNGTEQIILDATGTYDLKHKIISYEWLEDASLIATGRTASVIMTQGVHAITLRVKDNEANIYEDTVEITVSEPTPVQTYLDVFQKTDAGDIPLSAAGWSVLTSENGFISGYSNQSRVFGIASGEYAFYAPKMDNNEGDAVSNSPGLAFTHEPEKIDISTLSEINWNASGDNVDHEYRVAIQLDGMWYASNPSRNDGAPDSAAPADIPLSFSPESFANSTNWLEINNTTPGAVGVLSLGSPPSSNLTGLVTGFGLYLVPGTDNETAGDHVRFDNFEILVMPAPKTKPLISMFHQIQNGTWELTISGDAGTAYELFSTPDLELYGIRVTTLDQTNPTNDPGTVTAGSLLTTDASGYGRVRMMLSGDAVFIRVQSAQ